MNRRIGRALASFGVALVAIAALATTLACDVGPDESGCEGRPAAGVVSLWTACASQPLTATAVPLMLSNGSAETIWFYHECQDEVPWPERLQDDGTFLRLLPANFFLPTGCAHVMELAPGESMELSLSMRHVDEPGLYRAAMMIAHGCTHVHEPLHVPHSCDHVEFLESAPFELR